MTTMNENINERASEWLHRFHQLWKRSDHLFDLLRSSDDYYQRPIQLRLPLIFYLGHLPCFAWAQFQHLPNVKKTIDALCDKIFQRGVDPDVLTGIVHHGHSSRFSMSDDQEKEYWQSFSVDNVNEYKLKVRAEIEHVLLQGSLDFDDIETLNILNIAIEHELMHQETLMYLFAQLPIEALRCDGIDEENLRYCHVTLPLSKNEWVLIPDGQLSLGKPFNTQTTTYSFGWDNEFPCEPTDVSSFELQSHPVCIGDYLEFVLDNGYTTKEWWDDDIYEWIITSNISHPTSWTYHESYEVNFILQRNIPIDCVLDHPVMVSQVEAKAYCRWLSKKTQCTIDLPTEAEWIYAMWDWSKCIPKALSSDDPNVNFRHLHTTPVTSSCCDKNLQWQGSAFEWTSSVFRPFLGYLGSLPSYPGYSSDFFDDAHIVLLGGSFATDLTLIRRSFRNWFQDKYRYMFATFRCAKRRHSLEYP